MRSTISYLVAPLAAMSVLCHAAPSCASDTTASPGNRILALATIVAVTLLVLGLGLYFEVVSLRPLVRRAGIEAQAREDREEKARREVAKASADLHAALTELREQIQLMGVTRSPASEAPRDTLTMLPPAMPSAAPAEAARSVTLGDDDPTSVLSREALQQAMGGESQAPPAPD